MAQPVKTNTAEQQGAVLVNAPHVIALGELLRRFSGATPEMIARVLTPYKLVISRVGDKVKKSATGHSYLEFEAPVPSDIWATLEPGVSGKVVSMEFVEGKAGWREILKARIHKCDESKVCGELHLAGTGRFEAGIKLLKVGDVIEIDPFGVTSKIESALTEAVFYTLAKESGWNVSRMPENVAMHLGTQNYHDFRLERAGEVIRVELKSLWGTDTTQCRLIHTKSREGEGGKNSQREDIQIWRTSSCRFMDQDILAVNMWLRTGKINDFAYALSVPNTISKEWGLPPVKKFPEHVVQNMLITDPPSGAWTTSLEEAVNRLKTLRQNEPNLLKKLRALRGA